MSVKQRLKDFIKSQNISIRQFCLSIDVSEGFVSAMVNSMSPDKITRITTHYPSLNIGWLLTGEGNMLNTDVEHTQEAGESITPYNRTNNTKTKDVEIFTTYLLPMRAMGGSLAMAAEAAMMRDCEKIVSPIGKVDFAITITGESMTPEYPNGSQVLIKKVNEQAFIEWGRVYVLDTCNGPVIKKLMPSMRGDDHVMCVSINQDYPPFDVCKSDVFGVYQVLMCLSRK